MTFIGDVIRWSSGSTEAELRPQLWRVICRGPVSGRARSRTEVDRFHREFLVARGIPITDEPKEYPQYWPGYYAVFFDDPINGIHWELAWIPKIPTPR